MRKCADATFRFLIVAGAALAASACISTPPRFGEEAKAYVGAHVVDGTGAPLRENLAIVVEGDRIVSLLDTGSDFGAARIVDVTGRTIVPGLIDGHKFLASRRSGEPETILPELLAVGVTTVRYMGGDSRVLVDLQTRIRDGELSGPDILFAATVAGPLSKKDPDTFFDGYERGRSSFIRIVEPGDNGATVVAEAAETGATGLNLYSNLSSEIIETLTVEAHQRGMEVWARAAVWPIKPSDLSAAGVDVLSHAHGLIAEANDDLPREINILTDGWLATQDFAAVDPSGPRFQSLFASMNLHGQILEPTLHALRQSILPWRTHPPRPAPAESGARPKRPGIDVPAFAEFACAATRAAHEAGVEVSAGTGGFDALGVQIEVEHLVDCGLSPLQAIRAATLVNAMVLGEEDEIGSIEVGKRADFLVLKADPLEDLAALREIDLVVKGGDVVFRD